MSKKAIAETTTTVIIAIIIFILMLSLSTTMSAFLGKSRHREVCRISIIEAELGKTVTAGGITPQLDCPMQVIDITQNDIKKKKDPSAFVKKQFADLMRDTWYIAGKGEHVNFQEKLYPGSRIYCLVYARINMQDVELSKGDLGDMTTWLSTNNPAESTESYFGYMTYQNKRAWHIIDASVPTALKDAEEIDPKKNYYVVYWTTMKNYLPGSLSLLRDMNDILNIITGPIPQVFVVSEDQFSHIGCEALLN